MDVATIYINITIQFKFDPYFLLCFQHHNDKWKPKLILAAFIASIKGCFIKGQNEPTPNIYLTLIKGQENLIIVFIITH